MAGCAQQPVWDLCPGSYPNPPEIRILNTNNPDRTVKVEIIEPSCPRSKDGSIEILDIILRGYSTGFENMNKRISHSPGNIEDFNPISRNLGAGTHTILLYNIYDGRKLFDIDEIIFGAIEPEPKLGLFSKKNETCPGDKDGEIIFVASGVEESADPKVHLTGSTINGQEFSPGTYIFRGSNLSAGVHNYTFSFGLGDRRCCTSGFITLGTNACQTEVLNEEFNDISLPVEYFINPSDALSLSGGQAIFLEAGQLFIPFDLSPLGSPMYASVHAEMSDEVAVEVIASNMDPVAGPGEPDLFEFVNFYYAISGDPAGYILLASIIDGIIRGVKMNVYFDAIEELGPFRLNNNTRTNDLDSLIPQSYCLGDTIIPYDGFGIVGGVTPLNFKWSLDGDMVFDDADSLLHPVSFINEGSHSISLLIEDFVGQRDTLHFEYLARVENEITIGVPELDIAQDPLASLTVCLDQTPFQIVVQPDSSVLNTASLGLSGTMFNPSESGLGTHIIYASGDSCDGNAALVVSVIDQANSMFEFPAEIYHCQNNLSLNQFLTGDALGNWFLNDSMLLLNDSIQVADYPVGDHTISYFIGDHECLFEHSISVSIEAMPVLQIGSLPDTIESSDAPFELSQFLTNNSTQDGTWSGGDYIMDGFFNPSGLVSGFYPIIYTYAAGECFIADTAEIEIVKNSATISVQNNLSFEFYPSPVQTVLTVCPSEQISQRAFNYSIIDVNGRSIMNASFGHDCVAIDVSGTPAGIYFIKVSEHKTGSFGVGKFIIE